MPSGSRVDFVTTFSRRRLIALVAAYAIALQAVLPGFVALAMAGWAGPGICASASHGAPPGSPHSDCGSCTLLCGGGAALAAVAPSLLVLAPPSTPSPHLAQRAAPRTAQRLLPPSRAPPAAGTAIR